MATSRGRERRIVLTPIDTEGNRWHGLETMPVPSRIQVLIQTLVDLGRATQQRQGVALACLYGTGVLATLTLSGGHWTYCTPRTGTIMDMSHSEVESFLGDHIGHIGGGA